MRTHPVNVAHLVFGLVFLGVAGCWALSASGAVEVDPRWLLPLILLLAGGAGLVATLARSMRRPAGDQETTVERDPDSTTLE
jgi:hypothetical protein